MQKSSSALLEDLLDFAFTFGFADYRKALAWENGFRVTDTNHK